MLSNTTRTQIKKGSHKAVFDPQALYDIIDESLIAHIAIEEDRRSRCDSNASMASRQQGLYSRAKNSRLLRTLKTGHKTCLTFTLFDGWVLARSAFHHSAHYRSAVVFGQFENIKDNHEKDRVLNHFIEHIAPGRTEEVRLSNNKELTATQVLAIELNEASVKIGRHGVNDDKEDLDLQTWAGILPYRTVIGPLEPCDDLDSSINLPDYSSAYKHRWYK